MSLYSTQQKNEARAVYYTIVKMDKLIENG